MEKSDRLRPVLTIVIYYGDQPWDGPLRLKDMLSDIPGELQNYISDYRMNLLQVIESDAYTFHNEDVRTVFTLSRELLRGNIRQLLQKYQSQDIEIEAELLSVIGKIVGSSYIEKTHLERRRRK